jgi:hypothetical protein
MDSRSSNRRLVLAILAGAGLVVVMCAALVATVLVATEGSGRLSGWRAIRSLDRIAFVSPDNSLYVIDRNGQHVERLVAVEEGTSLGYPTWSPDGRHVAYLAQRQISRGVESGLYAVSTHGDTPTPLYTSTNDPPFYLYWSPDSRHISFLTQEDSGLALRLVLADGSSDARVLERGVPFYWLWSPEGEELFIHIGGARRFSGDARMAILSSRPDASPAMLEDAPASFQAPAWSPDYCMRVKMKVGGRGCTCGSALAMRWKNWLMCQARLGSTGLPMVAGLRINRLLPGMSPWGTFS